VLVGEARGLLVQNRPDEPAPVEEPDPDDDWDPLARDFDGPAAEAGAEDGHEPTDEERESWT
jgi:hypothetical protein